MGCCVALVLVPLLLLTTPSRHVLHASGAPADNSAGRARVGVAWTLPAVLADMVRAGGASVSGPGSTQPGEAALAADEASSSSVPRTVNAVSLAWREQEATTTSTDPPAAPRSDPQTSAVAAAPTATAPLPATTTTTTRPPAPKPPPPTTTTTTPPPPPPANTETGTASWYDAPAGTCASPSLSFGTVLTVTDVDGGKSVTCTVDDREAGNRVVDLSEATFAQLADPSAGLIDVRLTW